MAEVKNNMAALNDFLFQSLERITNDDLQGDELELEIKRAEVVTKVAQSIVSNGELALKAQKLMYDCGSAAQVEIPLLGITDENMQKKTKT